MYVGADLPLGLHGDFWIHANFVAVDMGLKCDAVVVDFGVGEGKHLEAARVGKSWAVPASKFGKTAGFFNEFWARGENEVVSIGKDTLGTKLAHLVVSDGFNGSTRGGADESWGLNIAVRRMDDAGAHEAVLFDDVEFEAGF